MLSSTASNWDVPSMLQTPSDTCPDYTIAWPENTNRRSRHRRFGQFGQGRGRLFVARHRAEGRLRRRQPRDRHAERRAAHVVQAGHVAKLDRRGIAAVLAADADFEIGPAGAAPLPRPRPPL